MRRLEDGNIFESDAVLVVKRLRECRSKTAMWCDQLAKAKLTNEEQEAIGAGIAALKWHVAWESKEIVSLEALLARLT
jgi:hypothetical protein